MKKFLSALLGLLMTIACFAFTGCEDFFAEETSESSSTEQEQEQEVDKYASRYNDPNAITCVTDGASITWNEEVRAWEIKGREDRNAYYLYLDINLVQSLKAQGKKGIRITYDTRVASQIAWLEVYGEKADGTGRLRFLRINNSGPLSTDYTTLDKYYELPLDNDECDYTKQIFLVMVNSQARMYLTVV